MSESLTQAINDMRTMRESYNQLGAAAEAYNTGKVQLAANITEKGVQASASETLPELAQKVHYISQETHVYEGEDTYGKQLSGDGALWDLYQVLAEMKNRFLSTNDYASLIVCEYYRGYDSLQLQGADGYYTCDGDYYDYASPNHVWHDADNGKTNRWVAFLYRDDGARLDITNTAISPRSMYIGGHIGTIEYFTNGRLTDLVCGIEETDILDNFLNKGFAQAWSKNTILRAGKIEYLAVGSDINYLQMNLKELQLKNYSTVPVLKVSFIDVFLTEDAVVTGSSGGILFNLNNSGTIWVCIKGGTIRYSGTNGLIMNCALTTKYIYVDGFCGGNLFIVGFGVQITTNVEDILIGNADQNVGLSAWNPTNVLADADKKAQLIDNIKNHILARVSDATGGTQLVLAVSTNMYNNIASEQIEWQGETMTLADAFLTKNWLLAGA